MTPTPQTTPTRDEATLRALIEELRPYAAKPLGSIRIDTDDIRKIVDWFDASAPAPASGRVDAVAVPKWVYTSALAQFEGDTNKVRSYHGSIHAGWEDTPEFETAGAFYAWAKAECDRRNASLASLFPAATPGWPDPLNSPQAEAIRAGKIDDTLIRDLFDQMERELKEHRARAATPVSEAGGDIEPIIANVLFEVSGQYGGRPRFDWYQLKRALVAALAKPAPSPAGEREASLSRSDVCRLWQYVAIERPSMTVEGFTNLLLNEIDDRAEASAGRAGE